MRARTAVRYFLLGLAVDATVIGFFALNPDYLGWFYSERFPLLSRLIFGVFFVGLGVTYTNFLRLLREESVLRSAVHALESGQQAGELAVALPPSGLRDRIRGLLARPAQADQADPAGQDALEAREETHAGWAKYITGVLTMLGLVGTFLGLMVAIDSIRGLASLEDKEAFFRGVLGALDGMGTAFSTSLAGIFGAVVLGFEQLVFHFAQMSYLTRVQLLIERVLAPQVQPSDSAGGIAVELHRFREDLRAWRTDVASAGAELESGARELAGQTQVVAEAVLEVLDRMRDDEGRWREVSEELARLRRLASEENQALLALAGHRLEGLELAAAESDSGVGGVEGETVSSDDAAGLSDDLPKGGVADAGGTGGSDSRLYGELRRSNDLLAQIYREMGLVLRSASNRLEMRQTEAMQAIARVLQRMDAQATSGAEQIHMLRALLRYVNKDDRKLTGVMDILREEAKSSAGVPDSETSSEER
jgi:biopolymer transport protein ExbB/TolQ